MTDTGAERDDELRTAPESTSPLADDASVDDLRAEVARLESEVDSARESAESRLNDLKRVSADFINYKRRTEAEQVDKAKFANAMLILKLLPVLDDLERAIDSVGPNLAGLQWVQGINLIARKMRSTLEAEGVTTIEALGEEFDPRVHEAVQYEDAGPDEAGKVVAVYQTGYKLHDRIIRPAMVKVGKEAEPAGEPVGES